MKNTYLACLKDNIGKIYALCQSLSDIFSFFNWFYPRNSRLCLINLGIRSVFCIVDVISTHHLSIQCLIGWAHDSPQCMVLTWRCRDEENPSNHTARLYVRCSHVALYCIVAYRGMNGSVFTCYIIYKLIYLQKKLKLPQLDVK